MNQNKLEKYLQKENPSLVNIPENRLIPVFLSDSKGRYLRQQAATPLEHDIVWVDQRHEGGRTTRTGLEWVRSNITLRKHPHMFYTPSFTLLYSRKGEMRGTQNEGLFSGLD